MSFPFEITDDMIDAVQAHIDYTSAGSDWLYKNDPECQNEMLLIERIKDAIVDSAKKYYADEEAFEDWHCDFYDNDNDKYYIDMLFETLEQRGVV